MSKFNITIINKVTNKVKEEIIIHRDIDEFSKILNHHGWTLIYYEKILQKVKGVK